MALDKEYFDAIDLEVVKKKYYNAKKVEAVFRDIQRQAAALEADNERMRAAISALADRRVELGDAVISGQGVYRGIVEKANARAQEIVAEAERRAAGIEKRSQQRQEEAVRRTERLFNAMKRQYQSAIDAINGEWQRYLCSLDSEEAETPEAADTSEAPDDLSDKVDAIARQIFAIEEGEEAPWLANDED